MYMKTYNGKDMDMAQAEGEVRFGKAAFFDNLLDSERTENFSLSIVYLAGIDSFALQSHTGKGPNAIFPSFCSAVSYIIRIYRRKNAQVIYRGAVDIMPS